METAIAALIILTVLLYGALTIAQVHLSSQDAIMTSWREMKERLGQRARTEISAVEAETTDAQTVKVTLSNEGDTKLADFDQWDVIVQYDSTGDGNCNVVEWLSYVEGVPISDEWSEDIGDIFEPDIFNPEEVMTITMSVSPPVAPNTTNLAIIGTPNGISVSTVFTR